MIELLVILEWNNLDMPTKTKHMARKASLSDSAPLAKQIKQEKADKITESPEMKIILDTDKVEAATKMLGKIPKKTSADTGVDDDIKDFPNADLKVSLIHLIPIYPLL